MSLNNDILFELLYFMGPKQILNFSLVCSNFNQLVLEFNRKELGRSILHRWKNTRDLLVKNYDLCCNADQFKVFDFTHEVRDIGISVVNLFDDNYFMNSKFFLYSLLTSEFFEIKDNCVLDDICVYKRHYIKSKNWLIYHGNFDYEEKDLLIDLSNIEKVTLKFFYFFALNDKHPLHSVTKLQHCSWCSKIAPDLPIDEIPYNRDSFERLPTGDILHITIDTKHMANAEATGQNWELSNFILFNEHQYFSDRYILKFTRRTTQKLQVVDIMTNLESDVQIDNGINSNYNFENISKFITIGDKYNFTCGKAKDWFVLWKTDSHWCLNLFKSLTNFSIPTYCPIEQRVII